MRSNCFRVALLAAMLGLMLAPAAAQDPPPTIDDTTSGAWIGTYGECAYVLGAYDNPFRRCETAIVDGTGVVPTNCTNYDPAAGGSQDVLDCEYDALDLDGNGDQDLFYRVYTGCSSKVLNNPDGSMSGTNSLWFGGCSANGAPFSYTLNGVPAGTYRVAVYAMDYDSNGARDQTIQVCVGGVCSGADAVGDHSDGVYQLYDVDVAPGESVTFNHVRTAGANPVAQGVFFDPIAGPLTCVNGKACSTTLQDTSTQGNWVGTYGSAGYVLLNRPVATKAVCQSPTATYQAGGFGAPVTVTANDAKSWYWGTPTGSYHCGYAAAWIWECDGDGRALQNPGDCGGVGQCSGGYTTAATWDDTGELQPNGPDLLVDVIVDLPGVWELSFYAVDYDTTVRQETFHLYEYQSQVPIFPPVDIGTYSNGKYVTYTLTGPFEVTLRVEKTAGANAIISGIFVDPAEGYDCEGEPPPPDCGDFCTYTIGGWGAPYHGANPGTIRDDNWMTVYPTDTYPDADGDGYGDLLIEGSAPQCKDITFTTPMAVEEYMPCGGRPRATNKSFTDPICDRKGNQPQKNTLMSQVVGLRLNVDYSCAGVIGDPESPVCLGDLVILSGPFAGDTVFEFLEKAEDALLCGFFAEGLDAPDYNWTATAINENFDGCEDNNGFLDCDDDPGTGGDCGVFITKELTLGDLGPVDRDGDGIGPDAYPGEEVTFTLNVESGDADLSNVVVTDVLPSFTLGGVDYDYYGVDATSCTFEPNYGQSCSYDDATNTMTVNLGNLAASSNVTISYTAQLSLLAPIGTEATNVATVTGDGGTGSCSDDDAASVMIVPGTPQYPTDDIGTPGYACNHVNQAKPNPFDAAEVNQWLLDIEFSSRWWVEFGGTLYDPSEPPVFQNVLSILGCQGGGQSDKQKLEKHLLTLWLNVADFRVATTVTLEEICLGGVPYPAGYDKTWTVGEVITYAEQALLDSDSANYLFWKDVIDAINNGVAPPCGP